MKYVASVSIPGYLPEGDTPVFDTPAEAWSYLADERERGEDDTYNPGDAEEYTETVAELRKRAAIARELNDTDGGVIYGDTPGYDGDHDLGLAYVVSAVSDADAAEIDPEYRSDADILREVGMDQEADDLDRELGGKF